MSKINFFDLSLDDLRQQITAWQAPAYRADQVWQWAYQQKADSFALMSSLPADLRAQLEAHFTLRPFETAHEAHSQDGETRKFLFRLADGQLIETVLMEYDGFRRTACLSTQAGCAMGCVFCATGQMGFARHLTHGEIVAQAVYVGQVLQSEGERLSNIVLMGMGEPFHNYDATLKAIRTMAAPDGLAIGQRHITVSTVGLPDAIRRFAGEDLQVRLAISLHAANDDERSKLLPINRRYPISQVLEAVHSYISQTGRRVTFEWALIAYENDSPEEAHRLGSLLQGLLCHVNVIPLNPTAGYSGQKSPEERVNRFVEVLHSYGIPATVRVRRGIDIHAGCGQLKADVLRRKGGQAITPG